MDLFKCAISRTLPDLFPMESRTTHTHSRPNLKFGNVCKVAVQYTGDTGLLCPVMIPQCFRKKPRNYFTDAHFRCQISPSGDQPRSWKYVDFAFPSGRETGYSSLTQFYHHLIPMIVVLGMRFVGCSLNSEATLLKSSGASFASRLILFWFRSTRGDQRYQDTQNIHGRLARDALLAYKKTF